MPGNRLCTSNGILCIGEQGSDLANPADVGMTMDNYTLSTYLIKWSHPNVAGTTGEIEDPYGFCLQVAADEDYEVRAADGDAVYADACTPGGGSSYWYQQWGSN